jgi:UDP-N-acetyl-D-galactosamine dehydrogenase
MKISIIGLGYVGLPLAVEFSKLYETIGYDLNQNRIQQIISLEDINGDLESSKLAKSKAKYTSSIEDIADSDIYIVTVPTPIDEENNPDLSLLESACKTIGKCLDNDNIVIFESTVYPGTTEEICVPILESTSGLSFINENNKKKVSDGFFCGYSPERINPGDKVHYLTNILKITSGSTTEIAKKIDDLYGSIILAGTYIAQSIMVAEAAKIIENTQRDVNIALVNELSIIFGKMGINTKDVLDAAETKWNFNRFDPGLVGGHCIGVDPYYLAYKSIQVGHTPEMILSGRKINDGMPGIIVSQIESLLEAQQMEISTCEVLIMGLAFKKDCKDLRNSKVFDLAEKLKKFGANIEIFDPFINQGDVEPSNIFKFIQTPRKNYYDVIIIAVDHTSFVKMDISEIKEYGTEKTIVYDVKSIYDSKQTAARL